MRVLNLDTENGFIGAWLVLMLDAPFSRCDLLALGFGVQVTFEEERPVGVMIT